MKTLTLTAVVLAAIAVGFMAATVEAQYYTPLRYDLRMSSPTYIPGGTLQFGPADKPNPYAFGQQQTGNLSLTGNLRFGQSFQGNVPYNQQGDQMSVKLPSLTLSNFTRDSYGAADIGTGLTTYGSKAEPYFPTTGSVTNVSSAMTAFVPQPPGSRAPYVPATGLSTPVVVTPTPTAGSFFSPTVTPTGTEGMRAAEANGIAIPPETLAWLDKLVAGNVSPVRAEASATGGAGRVGATGMSSAGAQKPITTPYDVFDENLMPSPDNLVNPNRPKPPAAAEKSPATDADQVLYWVKRGPPSAEERAAGTPPPSVAKASPKKWTPEGLPASTELSPQAILAAAGQPIPVPTTYAKYVERAYAAMWQEAYENAETLFSAAEAMNPNQPEAFFGRLNAMLAMKNLLQASNVLQRDLGRHPDWLSLTPELRLYYSPDTYNRLVMNLVAELKARPDSLDFNLLMGYVHFAAGAKREAVYYLEKAAKARAERSTGKEVGTPGVETLMLKAIPER